MNLCSRIVNWTLRITLQWDINQNTRLFIHENASENVVCEMTANLSSGRWVNVDSTMEISEQSKPKHDDVIKWKHFPRYWPFVRGIHRSPVNSPHKGQWRGALKFSLIYAWINDWVNNGKAGDLRRHPGHHDVTVMNTLVFCCVVALVVFCPTFLVAPQPLGQSGMTSCTSVKQLWRI